MPIYILLSRLSQQGVATLKVALGARGSTKIQTLPALTIDELVATLT